ncbi:hypothetical protein BHE74_00021932 [Ensete ventricosum]|nr:hypothetical protein BHE74_00021932 [Ensete ventricosum]
MSNPFSYQPSNCATRGRLLSRVIREVGGCVKESRRPLSLRYFAGLLFAIRDLDPVLLGRSIVDERSGGCLVWDLIWGNSEAKISAVLDSVLQVAKWRLSADLVPPSSNQGVVRRKAIGFWFEQRRSRHVLWGGRVGSVAYRVADRLPPVSLLSDPRIVHGRSR